jgi:hypothetical protein
LEQDRYICLGSLMQVVGGVLYTVRTSSAPLTVTAVK